MVSFAVREPEENSHLHHRQHGNPRTAEVVRLSLEPQYIPVQIGNPLLK